MKLNPHSIRPLISKHEVVHHSEITREIYDHPWDRHVRQLDKGILKKPNPPTQQDIERAKFVDKTYHWNPSRDGSLRPREQRSAK